LIQTKPIYAVIKQQARQVLIKTAEKNGISGANTMKNWQHPIQQAIQNTNAAVRYPDYYRALPRL